MTAAPELVEFEAADQSAMAERMAAMARDRSGWCNFEPAVDPDDIPPRRGLMGWLGWLGGSTRITPLCTWMPAGFDKGVDWVTIGVEHGTGGKARERLRATGTDVPDGWRVLNDHVRRGLVVAVPAGEPPAEVLAWLLRAGAALSTIPITGTWRATLYSR